MVDIYKIIVFENGEEYLVLDKVLKDEKEYYYIVKVNAMETDIENNFKLVTIEEKEGSEVINEVIGEDKLREILPLFAKENKS